MLITTLFEMFHFWYWYKRKTRQNFKPVILVTGCGSGIGLGIADLLYARKTYRVIVTARDKSIPLLQTRFKEDDRFWVRSLDVTSDKDQGRLLKEIADAWGGVNILVNNAGISYRAVIEHMTTQDELLQMNTNYLGPAGLIRKILPSMRQEGRGKIINISSVSGMLAMPTMASYSASKYALEGMSEALWYEVKPLGINVSLIQPGFVHSKSFEHVYHTELSDKALAESGPYSDYYTNMAPFIGRLMRLSLTGPRMIAKQVLRVIATENPPLWIPATFDAVIFYYLRRFVPRRLLMFILFSGLPRARRWGRKYTHKRK